MAPTGSTGLTSARARASGSRRRPPRWHPPQGPHGGTLPSIAAASVCVPRVSCRYPHLSGRFPRTSRQVGPGSCQMAALALGPGAWETLCAPFKNEVSISPQSCWAPQIKPLWLSKPNALGACLPSAGLPGWLESPAWGSDPPLLWENRCNYSPGFGPPPGEGGQIWNLILSRVCPSYLCHRASFFKPLVVQELLW